MTPMSLVSREVTRLALVVSLLITLVLGGGAVFGYWAYHRSLPVAIARTATFAVAMLLTHYAGYQLYHRQANGPLHLSPRYRDAIAMAAAAQVVIVFFASLILMSGLTQLCGIAAGGYWGGVALILFRRPTAPREDDLQFIRLGYLIALPITAVLASFVPRLAGWH